MSEAGDFQSLVRAGMLEIGDGYRAKNEELGGSGPVFLRAAYLQDDGFALSDPDRFASTDLARFGPKAAVLNDVVVTTKGNSTGRVGRIGPAEVGGIYSPHLSYWRSRNPEKLDQSFLYYWSRGSEFRNQLAAMSTSTDMAPYLSLRDQLSLQITLPDINVQKAVGRTLRALDDRIDLNRRMNETLEAMAQAIFHDWFVDFGPVCRKRAGATDPVEIMGGVTTDSARAAELARLFPDSLDQNGLPGGWRQGAARDLIEFNPREAMRGGTLAPYSDMASLPTRGTVADLPVMRPFGSGTRFRNGDALLARITPCLENGKGAWVDFLSDDNPVGWGSTEFIVLRGRAGTPAPFGYLLTRDPDFRRHAIQSMTGTSGRQRAQAESLETWSIALPAPPVLDAFGEHVNPLFGRITAAAEESRTLSETRDYLLPRLMSGQVSVGAAVEEIAA